MSLITVVNVTSYNPRRYGRPWACKIIDGKNEFIRGAYDGNDNGGRVYIEDPEEGQVYGVGQRDSRGNNSITIYLKWDGSKFNFCDRHGEPVDEDRYGSMLDSIRFHLHLDPNAESEEEE